MVVVRDFNFLLSYIFYYTFSFFKHENHFFSKGLARCILMHQTERIDYRFQIIACPENVDFAGVTRAVISAVWSGQKTRRKIQSLPRE